MVSEALQAEDVNNVDLSGLHNVSQKSSDIEKEPPVDSDIEDSQEPPTETKTEEIDHQMTFPEALSVNSVTTDG